MCRYFKNFSRDLDAQTDRQTNETDIRDQSKKGRKLFLSFQIIFFEFWLAGKVFKLARS